VLKRINVALRRFVDKIPIEHLPAGLLVPEPLSADLDSVDQPIRNDACQSANSRASQSS
jgi:hypothetical protein